MLNARQYSCISFQSFVLDKIQTSVLIRANFSLAFWMLLRSGGFEELAGLVELLSVGRFCYFMSCWLLIVVFRPFVGFS